MRCKATVLALWCLGSDYVGRNWKVQASQAIGAKLVMSNAVARFFKKSNDVFLASILLMFFKPQVHHSVQVA